MAQSDLVEFFETEVRASEVSEPLARRDDLGLLLMSESVAVLEAPHAASKPLALAQRLRRLRTKMDSRGLLATLVIVATGINERAAEVIGSEGGHLMEMPSSYWAEDLATRETKVRDRLPPPSKRGAAEAFVEREPIRSNRYAGRRSDIDDEALREWTARLADRSTAADL